MRAKYLFLVVSLLVIASMALGACQPAATPETINHYSDRRR